MDITLSTPALLFPAITLLLLAYTNRFLAIATLIRNLHKNFSLFLCIASMFTFYIGLQKYGDLGFGASLLSMLVSLTICLQEIFISTKALEIELSDMES